MKTYFLLSIIVILGIVAGTDVITTTVQSYNTVSGIHILCPNTWKFFQRVDDTYWCMKIFTGTVNHTEAQQECAKYGANLSGFENTEEQLFAIKRGQEILNDLNLKYGSLWVGAERLPACRGCHENATNCQPWASNAYNWTTYSYFGEPMYISTSILASEWASGQPDYFLEQENCVQMQIINGTNCLNKAKSGNFDDVPCSISTSASPINAIIGYVCGQGPDSMFGY